MRSIRKTTSGKTPKASTTCGRRCGRVQSASCTRHHISRTGRAHTGPHAFGDYILRLAEAAGTQQGVLFWRVWGTTPTMILSFEARGILRELRTGRTAAIAKRTWSDQHVLAIATTLQQVQSIRAISKCNRSVVAIAGNDRARKSTHGWRQQATAMLSASGTVAQIVAAVQVHRTRDVSVQLGVHLNGRARGSTTIL